MGEVSRALGQGTEFEFEGKKYVLSPWTYDVMGKFERYLEERAWAVARRAAAVLPPEDRKEHFAQVNKDVVAGEYSFGSDTVRKALNSIEHFKYLYLLMLLPNHPDATKDLVDRIFEADSAVPQEQVVVVNADPSTPTPAGAGPAVGG